LFGNRYGYNTPNQFQPLFSVKDHCVRNSEGSEKLFQCDGTDIYYVTITVTMKKLIDVYKYVCFRQYMRGARCMTEIKLKDKVAIIT
jgi:hypothetical protein